MEHETGRPPVVPSAALELAINLDTAKALSLSMRRRCRPLWRGTLGADTRPPNHLAQPVAVGVDRQPLQSVVKDFAAHGLELASPISDIGPRRSARNMAGVTPGWQIEARSTI